MGAILYAFGKYLVVFFSVFLVDIHAIADVLFSNQTTPNPSNSAYPRANATLFMSPYFQTPFTVCDEVGYLTPGQEQPLSTSRGGCEGKDGIYVSVEYRPGGTGFCDLTEIPYDGKVIVTGDLPAYFCSYYNKDGSLRNKTELEYP